MGYCMGRGILYIYIVYSRVDRDVGGLGWVVEWGHETKNNRCFPDPRENNTKKKNEEQGDN